MKTSVLRVPSLARFCCLLLWWGVLMGCGHKKPKKDADLEQVPKIQAESPQIQQEFDQAMGSLGEGDWARSRQKFEEIAQRAPQDPVAPLAALYAARAMLGEVSWRAEPLVPEASGGGAVAEAVGQFAGLAGQEGLDSRVRYAAMLYQSLGSVIQGDMNGAKKALQTYPGASMSYVVLPGDRAFVRWVLAEGLASQGRREEAVEAAAALFDSVSQMQGEVGQGLRRWARGRALGLIEEGGMDVEVMQMQWVASDDPFLRAMGAWGILWGQVEQGTPWTLTEQEQLEVIAQDGAEGMLAIGAMEAAAEMRYWVSTRAGAKRPVIAAVLPMSGAHQGVGMRAMRGHLLAQRAFDRGGRAGGATVVFYDSTKDAQELFDQFDRDGVVAIVGPLEREKVAEYERQAKQAGLPLVTLTPEEHEGTGGWAMSFFLSPKQEARQVVGVSARVMRDAHLVVLEPDTGYGRELSKVAQAVAQAAGQRVSVVTYARESTTLEPVAGAVAGLKPDAIFIPDTGNKVAALAAALSSKNIWGVPGSARTQMVAGRHQVHYLGTSLWQDDFVLRQAARELEGALVPIWFSERETTPQSVAFYTKYKAIFGATPTAYDVFAYDASRWLAQLLTDAGTRTAAGLRNALGATGYKGVSGDSAPAQGGRIGAPPRFLTIASGAFVPLEVRVPEAPEVLPPRTLGEPAP